MNCSTAIHAGFRSARCVSDRPEVVIHVDPSIALDAVEQGRVVNVLGWPTVGRAVAVDIDGLIVMPIYPCMAPVFRPMRFR